MKIHIELIEDDNDEEIVIKTKDITKEIKDIQKFIQNRLKGVKRLVLYKGEEELYVPVENILFFETSEDSVYAHTKNDAYMVKHRLYELEKELPEYFMRVSKSTIINITKVMSIQKNLTSSSLVRFMNSVKEVYVSRMYYKELKLRLHERSYYE
ncbi:LytTr DNA-binding domain-containing protein [Breznakia blatticola]|uniref:LytTr DNA-binding domain-containing protein n=1 Tax=Breznakia blatticola TaxID=1754012 RepID=A0A4R8A8N1_9FIRM|nr:LytTR family DNA-binding domain-containing protein [Breznakia blatticola]TDW24700.1 LytTr DNA-binding domain-containing protein [Breznakia blatticola]